MQAFFVFFRHPPDAVSLTPRSLTGICCVIVTLPAG